MGTPLLMACYGQYGVTRPEIHIETHLRLGRDRRELSGKARQGQDTYLWRASIASIATTQPVTSAATQRALSQALGRCQEVEGGELDMCVELGGELRTCR
jgi:hypothetical protein